MQHAELERAHLRRSVDGVFLLLCGKRSVLLQILNDLAEKRAQAPERRSLDCPPLPENEPVSGDPAVIFQIRTAEQLAPELAELKPDYLYVPAIELLRNYDAVEAFTEKLVSYGER